MPEAAERPLDKLLDDLSLPGHRQMAAHWLELRDRAGGDSIPRLADIDATRFAKMLADAEGRVRHILGATLFHGRADHGKGGIAAFIDTDFWYPAGSN